MLPQNNPDRIRIVFDDHRLVANLCGYLTPPSYLSYWYQGYTVAFRCHP